MVGDYRYNIMVKIRSFVDVVCMCQSVQRREGGREVEGERERERERETETETETETKKVKQKK